MFILQSPAQALYWPDWKVFLSEIL